MNQAFVLFRRPARAWASVFLLMTSVLGFPANALDVNQADIKQLQEIKGIGPKTALLIQQERDRAGPFVSYDDLRERVKGIGPKKLQKMQESGLTIQSTKRAEPVLNSIKSASTKPALRRNP